MDNYPYIIASLPDLIQPGAPQSFDYEGVSAFIRSQLSAADCRKIDWLEAGFTPKYIRHHFYRFVARSRSRFLRDYFAFDEAVRKAKVAFLQGEPVSPDAFEEAPALIAIFACKDIIGRERQLDQLYWEKASDLVRGHLFDMDVILSFLVHAALVQRWNALDPETGRKLFADLVSEVRGTFKGVEFDTDTPEKKTN